MSVAALGAPNKLLQLAGTVDIADQSVWTA